MTETNKQAGAYISIHERLHTVISKHVVYILQTDGNSFDEILGNAIIKKICKHTNELLDYYSLEVASSEVKEAADRVLECWYNYKVEVGENEQPPKKKEEKKLG